MSSDELSRVTELALALSLDEQVILIFRLEESLRSTRPDPKVEAAWEVEIERRLREVEAGEIELIDSEVVFREARERLARRREEKAPSE